MTDSPKSLTTVFADLRQRRRIGVMPFIPAGYPGLAATAAMLPAIELAGASAIEIGIPFSDPVADGPVIQEAFGHALAQGIKVRNVFDCIRRARPSLSIPLVAMVSFSIVFRYGIDRFTADARSAGFDGLIIPDLPPPEAQAVCAKVRSAGLDTILLVSPTTAPERRPEITRLCSGFVYYLSVSGITGERDRLPANVEENLRQLRKITAVPLCVGFGISKPEHVRQLAGLADGAIVGSAVVRRIREHLAAPLPELCAAVTEYCRGLCVEAG
ncbi:MAG: tryptophan synthase subunit alpha [Tepidisphaeraceae bacterium]